jgi:hypothetical protein
MLRKEDAKLTEGRKERSRGNGGGGRSNRACWVAFQAICRIGIYAKVVGGVNKKLLKVCGVI